MAPHLDVDAVPARCFGLAEELRDVDGDWHAHGRHQLLFAISGTLHLFVEGGQWLLPPQRAAWIRGGTRHRVYARHAQLRTVYLHPSQTPAVEAPCGVFGVNTLAREMFCQAMVWGPDHDPEDPIAQAFFRALGGLSHQWLDGARPYCLPQGESGALRKAMAYCLGNLKSLPTLPKAAKAAGVSPRTLERRFKAEAGTTWRRFLHSARMLYAMERLVEGEVRVIEVALELGFESPGAFTRSFRRFVGETPRDYRRRGRAGDIR